MGTGTAWEEAELQCHPLAQPRVQAPSSGAMGRHCKPGAGGRRRAFGVLMRYWAVRGWRLQGLAMDSQAPGSPSEREPVFPAPLCCFGAFYGTCRGSRTRAEFGFWISVFTLWPWAEGTSSEPSSTAGKWNRTYFGSTRVFSDIISVLVCGQERGHVPHLTSPGEARVAGPTNSD